MKVHLHHRIALFYANGFTQIESLRQALAQSSIELHLVEQEGLFLSVSALCGYVDAPVPERTYDGRPLDNNALVFSGLTEEMLSRTLERLREESLPVEIKAVVTPQNRHWAFGSLVQECIEEKKLNDLQKKDKN